MRQLLNIIGLIFVVSLNVVHAEDVSYFNGWFKCKLIPNAYGDVEPIYELGALKEYLIIDNTAGDASIEPGSCFQIKLENGTVFTARFGGSNLFPFNIYADDPQGTSLENPDPDKWDFSTVGLHTPGKIKSIVLQADNNFVLRNDQDNNIVWQSNTHQTSKNNSAGLFLRILPYHPNDYIVSLGIYNGIEQKIIYQIVVGNY